LEWNSGSNIVRDEVKLLFLTYVFAVFFSPPISHWKTGIIVCEAFPIAQAKNAATKT